MKKTLILTAALGLISASPLMALDLYITGSTAFRANVHDACTKLFDTLPVSGTTLRYGPGTANNGNAQWTMTGTCSNKISVLGTTPLTIHAIFTGSVQGNQAVVTPGTKQVFLDTAGANITNTPTIAFSDCASSSTPYPATGNYSEETVAIQPFVVCRSAVNNTNLTNMTWEQLRYASQAGRIPLSSFTGKAADRTTFVYQLERTKDSGTRRTQFAQVQFGFNQSATVYNYDVTNNVFYKATNTVWGLNGGNSNAVVSFGVVGTSPGFNNNNANSTWGSGYVGGGDVRTALYTNNPANISLAILSFADAKTAIGGTNWPQVISFGGLWPTAAGVGVRGNTGTNDFSPITSGSYGLWGNEVVIYPNVDPSSISGDQNLSAAILGNQGTAGTILGVLDAVTVGTPVVGSIDNEIELSKTGSPGATAIRVNDMVSSRASVGGTITP